MQVLRDIHLPTRPPSQHFIKRGRYSDPEQSGDWLINPTQSWGFHSLGLTGVPVQFNHVAGVVSPADS